MTTLVEFIRTKVPQSCCARKCQAQGCSVNMKGAPEPFVLIAMDCQELSFGGDSPRCDFVFFSDNGNWVAPIELKAGKVGASELVRQLQAGAQFAERVVPKSVQVKVVPIAVCGGKAHRKELNQLRKNTSRIRFRGNGSRNIVLRRCGISLVEVLSAED